MSIILSFSMTFVWEVSPCFPLLAMMMIITVVIIMMKMMFVLSQSLTLFAMIMIIIVVVIMIMMFDLSQSLTLLSPVDGLDPFGLVPIYCITPGEMLNFR